MPVTPPAAPTRVPDTRWATPSGGTLWDVSDATGLTNALASCNDGDRIRVAPGLYVGNFLLRNRGSGTGYVYIMSQAKADGVFGRTATTYVQDVTETPGQRIKVSDSSLGAGTLNLPRLMSDNIAPVFGTLPGAHHWWIEGFEVCPSPSFPTTYPMENGLINTSGYGTTVPYYSSLADVPHHIIVGHCALHGTPTQPVRRGVYANGSMIGVRDCSIWYIWSPGADSQAVGAWNSPGGLAVLNCFTESGGENILFGGAGPIMDSYPADFMKDFTTWNTHQTKDPTRSGLTKKNLYEHKNGARARVRRCIFEHSVVEGQDGVTSLWQTLNDSNLSPPQQDISDVDLQDLIVYGGCSSFDIIGVAGYASPGKDASSIVWPTTRTRRVRFNRVYLRNVASTLPEASGGNGWFLRLANNAQDISVNHLSGEGSTAAIVLGGRATINGVLEPCATNVEILDSLIRKGAYGSIFEDGGLTNQAAINDCIDGIKDVRNNVFYRDPAQDADENQISGNYYVLKDDVGFAAYQPQDPGALAPTSPYHNAGTDGTDLGAGGGIATVETAVRETSLPWGETGGGGGTPQTLTTLTLTPTTAQIQIGDTATLFTVEALDQFGVAMTLPSLTIRSSNPALAAITLVGSSLQVHGLSAGITQVTVASGLVVSPSAALTVVEPPLPPTQTLTSLVLQPNSVNGIANGAVTPISVGAFDSLGAPMSIPSLVFSSSNEAVAKIVALIGSQLQLQAFQAGICHVWVSSGAVVSGKVTVLVSDPAGGKGHHGKGRR